MKFFLLFLITSLHSYSTADADQTIAKSDNEKISQVGIAHKNSDEILITAVGVIKEKSEVIACIFDQNEFKKIPQLFSRNQDFNIPPGIQFLEEPNIENILAYEDLNNIEINFDDLQNDNDSYNDDEIIESEYTFISKNNIDSTKNSAIIAFNDEKIAKKNENELIDIQKDLGDELTPSIRVSIEKLIEGKKLVTNKQYNKYIKSQNDSKKHISIDKNEDHPVIDISLEDAEKYARWRNKSLTVQKNKSYGIGLGLLSETEDKVEWIPIPLPNLSN